MLHCKVDLGIARMLVLTGVAIRCVVGACGVASEVPQSFNILEFRSKIFHPTTSYITKMADVMESHVEQAPGKEEELHQLNLKLDDLFERYLNLLDRYQAARKELSTQLSSVREHMRNLTTKSYADL
jgi:hypothetical protein